MKWHAADVARGLEAGYLMLAKTVRADHQVLKLLCAKLENKGVIRGALDWDARRWRLFSEGTLEQEEIEAVITARLAVYVNDPVATSIEEETDPDCGWVTLADVRALEEASDRPVMRSDNQASDRSETLPEAMSDRISCDQTSPVAAIRQPLMRSDNPVMRSDNLVVIDYDLGGEIQNRLTREAQRNKAIIGAKKRAGQLALPLPVRPPDQCLIASNGPVIGHSAGDRSAAAEHGSRFTERSPPTPPGGGAVPDGAAAPDDQQKLDRFWAWFLAARPTELRGSDRWGGGRLLCFAAIVTRAAAEGKTAGAFADELRGVLERLFRDQSWVKGMAKSDRHFKSWIRSGDYWQPPAPPAPVLKIVRPAEPVELTREERRRAVLLARLERPDVPEAEKERIRAELAGQAAAVTS
jgi:hypothetical protein